MKLEFKFGRSDARAWIAAIEDWTDKGALLHWGDCRGGYGTDGIIEIEAEAGDVIYFYDGRISDFGKRKTPKPASRWAIVQADGSLTDCTRYEAKAQYLMQSKVTAAGSATIQ